MTRTAMWWSTLVLLAGCRPEDPLARARQELAEQHAAAVSVGLEAEPERAAVAAQLAAQADPLDPKYQRLAVRARAFEALWLGPELPRDRWVRAEYESDVGERTDPDFKHAYRAVFCLVTFVRGDAVTAERDLSPVVKEHPKWATGHALLGRILEANAKADEALAEYSRALELDLGARAPYVPAARLMLARGDHASAIKTLEAALPHGETLPVRLLLTEAYDRAGRLTDATAQLERAVRLDPKNGAIHLNYADHLLREGRYSEAEIEFNAASRLGIEPLATRGIGVLATALKDWPRAARSFEAVLQLNPKDTYSLFAAGEAFEQLGKPADAAKYYQRFAEAAGAVPAEVDRVAVARERVARLSKTK